MYAYGVLVYESIQTSGFTLFRGDRANEFLNILHLEIAFFPFLSRVLATICKITQCNIIFYFPIYTLVVFHGYHTIHIEGLFTDPAKGYLHFMGHQQILSAHRGLYTVHIR